MIEYDESNAAAIVRMSNGPVNSLGHSSRKFLADAFRQLATDNKVKMVILTGENNTFSAGADISEFSNMGFNKGPMLTEVVDVVEQCPKPVIAAVDGVALGGGCELALACHFRAAAPGARFGLPEVNIGLLPGAGGTQRLPRAVPAAEALDVMLTGRMVPAQAALASGLVDAVAAAPGPQALLEAALSLGRAALRDPQFTVGARRLSCKGPRAGREAAEAALAAADKALSRRRGDVAPQRAVLAAVRAGLDGFAAGMAEEGRLFGELMPTEQSRARRYLFFGERAAFNVPRPSGPLPQIRTVGVLGAGTMGGGIAVCLLRAGYRVALVEARQAGLDHGVRAVRGIFLRDMTKGRLSVDECEKILGRLTPSLDYGSLADVDMVIEAVFENMKLKKEIFAQLDAVTKPDCILCSNTSTLDIDEIASVTSRPDKVLGMHFFSPAHLMRLCEVILGARSSDATVAVVMHMAKRIRKVAVLVGNCHGFVGNRAFFKQSFEAVYLVEEGCPPARVDGVMRKFGNATGPLQTGDIAGNDISYKVRQELGLTDPNNLPEEYQKERWSGLIDMLAEANRLGVKTGKGWYKYSRGSFVPQPDPELEPLLEEYRRKHGLAPRPASSFTDEEILTRVLYPLINEGFKILEEGIAAKPSDVDTVFVNGYGFPAHKGGPMFQADEIGLPQLLEKVREYQAKFPNVHYWKPSALLEDLVRKGQTLAQYWAEHGSESILDKRVPVGAGHHLSKL